MNKLFWLIATARNAIIVVFTGILGYYFHQSGQDAFKMIGDIPAGLPSVAPPPFSIPEIRNETTGEIIQPGESFFQMVSSMGSGVIVVPLIALLENMSICKAFGERHHLTHSHPSSFNKFLYIFQLMANLWMPHRS